MRRGRSQRERADENPDRQPAAFLEPSSDDLHSGRIYTGQCGAREEPARDTHTLSRRHRDSERRNRGERRRPRN